MSETEPTKPLKDNAAAAEMSPVEKARAVLQPRQAAGDEAERTLWSGGYSPKAMIGTWLLCVLASVAAIVVSLVLAFFTIVVALIFIAVLWVVVALLYGYRRLGYAYELTSQRFIHKSGILTRRTDRIEVIDIDDVTYKQGLVQRMLGVGSIEIQSSDRTHPVLNMSGIANVQDVASLIDDTRRSERRRRSLHIEAI